MAPGWAGSSGRTHLTLSPTNPPGGHLQVRPSAVPCHASRPLRPPAPGACGSFLLPPLPPPPSPGCSIDHACTHIYQTPIALSYRMRHDCIHPPLAFVFSPMDRASEPDPKPTPCSHDCVSPDPLPLCSSCASPPHTTPQGGGMASFPAYSSGAPPATSAPSSDPPVAACSTTVSEQG